MSGLVTPSRRRFLKSTAATGAVASFATPNLMRAARAQDLPDPAAVLADISVDKYVREDYRALYNMSSEPLWDPSKDWIRTVDWEAVRSAQAGKNRPLRDRRCRYRVCCRGLGAVRKALRYQG